MPSLPNILVVMTDGQRRHSLGCMGADPVFTPHLDRFAREGFLAENAVCNSPLCTPSRACFLTGKHPGTLTGTPPRVNMLYNWQRLPIEEETFAKAAARAGYDTALIGKWHLDDYEDGDLGNHWSNFTPPGPRRMGFRFWYSNGCDHDHFRLRYNDTEGRLHELGQGWQPDHETDVAIRYLRNADGAQRPADRPFCLWMNWSPPHNLCGGPRMRPDVSGPQYAAPESDEAIYHDPLLPVPHPATHEAGYRREAPGYLGAVTALDRAFGRLLHALDELGLRDNTIVVFTSDHGEMLGIHRRWMKDVWHEQSIGVPLLLRWPGHVPAGLRSRALFGLVDVMPTVLALAGAPMASGRHGRDISDLLLGRSPHVGHDQLVAFNTGAPPPELTRFEFPAEPGRYWRALRTPTHTYLVIDKRPEGYWKFHDKTRYDDAFPADVTCVAWDLAADPLQLAPIYPGRGQDPLLRDLHARLARKLADIGDDFLARYWQPHPAVTT